MGDHVQILNLRGKNPKKSDQAGVITSNNVFSSSNYSVKVLGSGLITKHNRATMRKVLHTVQTGKVVFGQGQRQRADKAEQVGQPADPEHSRPTGGGFVSHPVIEPGAVPAEGSVDIVDSLVVTLATAQ